MLMRQRTYVAVSSVLAAAAGAGVVFVATDVGHHSAFVRPPAAAAPSVPQASASPGGRQRHSAAPAPAAPAPGAQQPALADDLQPAPAATATAATQAPAGSGKPDTAGNSAPASSQPETTAPPPPPAPSSPSPSAAPRAVPSSQPSCTVGVKLTVISVCARIGG